MINYDENQNDNGKINRISKTLLDLDLHIETSIQNIACLGKTMSLCNKYGGLYVTHIYHLL